MKIPNKHYLNRLRHHNRKATNYYRIAIGATWLCLGAIIALLVAVEVPMLIPYIDRLWIHIAVPLCVVVAVVFSSLADRHRAHFIELHAIGVAHE